MPTMPVGLEPVADGYAIQAPDGVLRTVVGGGLPRYALDWDRGYERVTVSMVLDSLQFAVWTAFYLHVIRKGAIAFDMPLDTGAGVQTHTVQIVPDTYRAQRASGDVTRVSFTAQTESSAYAISETDALALIAAFEGARGAPLLELLRPEVASFSTDAPDGTVVSDVSGGHAAIAAAWDRTCQRFQVTLLLTPAEFQVWNAYFHHVAKKGAVAFPMYLDSGMGTGEHMANIVPGSYSAVRSGRALTVVTFVAEAEPDAYDMTHSEAAALVDLYNGVGTGTDVLLDRIATFANQDTLVLAP